MVGYKVMVSEDDKDITITTGKLTTAMLTFVDLCGEHEGKAVYLYRLYEDVDVDGEVLTNQEIVAVGNLNPSMKLEDCGMSVRAYNVARRAGCTTAAELICEIGSAIAESEEEPWHKFRNCGKRTWKEFMAIHDFMDWTLD